MELFPSATPIPTKWKDPGDQRRRKSPKVASTGVTIRPRKAVKEDWKPNPFRQPLATDEELLFRHCSWCLIRDRVQGYLLQAGIGPHSASRFANCGAECVVEWSETAQRYRLRGSYCHSRHCRPCSQAKAGLIAANLRKKLEAGPAHARDRYRFVTLTLKHSDRPLLEQKNRLFHCFARLRNSKLWRENTKGGSASTEIKWTTKRADGTKCREWHPHIHIIAEGNFIRQEDLSHLWHEITGDSYMVDIKSIKSTKDAVHYVTKYCTKGTNDEVWDDADAAIEWLTATKGMRTATTFGTWRGFRLTRHDPLDDVKDWKPVYLLHRLMVDAQHGHAYANAMMGFLIDAHMYDPHRKRQRAPHDKSD